MLRRIGKSAKIGVVEAEQGGVGKLRLALGVVDGVANQPQVTHVAQASPQLIERRLVGLHVADLEHQPPLTGERVEADRRRNGETQRFLGEHVLAGEHRCLGHDFVAARGQQKHRVNAGVGTHLAPVLRRNHVLREVGGDGGNQPWRDVRDRREPEPVTQLGDVGEVLRLGDRSQPDDSN